ncbi:MAG: hypothetical protein AAF388_05810 [Bacteroidota bacterium]
MVILQNLACLSDYRKCTLPVILFMSLWMLSFHGFGNPTNDSPILMTMDTVGSFSQMQSRAKAQGKYLVVFFYDIMSSRSREAEKLLYTKYQKDKQFNNSVLLMRQNGFAVSGEARQLRDSFQIENVPALLVLDAENQVVGKLEGGIQEEVLDKMFYDEVVKEDVLLLEERNNGDEVVVKSYRSEADIPENSIILLENSSLNFFPSGEEVIRPDEEGYRKLQYGLIIDTGLSWEQCVQRTGAWLLLWNSMVWAKYESEDRYSLVLGGSEKKSEVKKFQRYLRKHELPSSVSLFAPDVYYYRRLY